MLVTSTLFRTHIAILFAICLSSDNKYPASYTNNNPLAISSVISFTLEGMEEDSIQVTLYPEKFGYIVEPTSFTVQLKNNKSQSILIPSIASLTQFTISMRDKLPPGAIYYVSPDEKINFHIRKQGAKLESLPEGDNKEKMNTFQELHLLRNGKGYFITPENDSIFKNFNHYTSAYKITSLVGSSELYHNQLNYLEKRKHLFSPEDYEVIKSDITGMYIFRISHDTRDSRIGKKDLSEIASTYEKLSQTAINSVKTYTYTLMQACLEYCKTRSFLIHKSIINDRNSNRIIEEITKNFTGELRDKLIINYFTSAAPTNPDMFRCQIKKYIQLLSNKMDISFLNNLLEINSKNAPFFPFELQDTTGKNHRLADFRGKVVLIDLWFTGCSGCVKVASTLHKNVIPNYKGKNVQFITISTDRERERWVKGILSGNYTSTEELNLYTNGLGEQHPLTKYYNIVSAPYLILIDQNGNLINLRMPRTGPEICKEIDALLQAKE